MASIGFRSYGCCRPRSPSPADTIRNSFSRSLRSNRRRSYRVKPTGLWAEASDESDFSYIAGVIRDTPSWTDRCTRCLRFRQGVGMHRVRGFAALLVVVLTVIAACADISRLPTSATRLERLTPAVAHFSVLHATPVERK